MALLAACEPATVVFLQLGHSVSAPLTVVPHCGQIYVDSLGMHVKAPISAAFSTQIEHQSVTGQQPSARPLGVPTTGKSQE